MNVPNFLLGIIVVLVPIALLFLFVGYIFYTTKALKELQPGIKLWGRESGYNPGNLLISQKYFTEKGKKYRKASIRSILFFLILLLVWYLFSTLPL